MLPMDSVMARRRGNLTFETVRLLCRFASRNGTSFIVSEIDVNEKNECGKVSGWFRGGLQVM